MGNKHAGAAGHHATIKEESAAPTAPSPAVRKAAMKSKIRVQRESQRVAETSKTDYETDEKEADYSAASAGYSAAPAIPKRNYKTVKFKSKEFKVDTRYGSLKPVGKGAYGVVCAAKDNISNELVAIKKVEDVFVDLVDAKRILREVKLLNHLAGHPNIVNLRDIMVGPNADQNFEDLYMVFNRFECDLQRIIESTQTLSEAHIQYFLYQILKGLKWIHSAGVMHRDLKPANLLVMQNCDLAICDFGLARGGEDEDAQKTEYVVTRWYRAPELLCENNRYDSKIDVWSVGLIFGEMLKRSVVLRGRDYIDQLRLAVRLMGQVSEEDLKAIDKRGARDLLSRWTYPGADFKKEFPGSSSAARDLIRKMLSFNPHKRFTVDDALDHPFLASVRDEVCKGVEDKSKREPECKAGKFDDSFEKDYPLETEMPKALLQKHMFAEFVKFSHKLEKSDAERES